MSFSILFVCTGNICRSPLAERLLHARLGATPGDQAETLVVRSAGTHGWEGSAMDPMAASELRRLGGDPTGFRGRQLTGELIAGADLVLTATRAHRRAVLGEVPQALRRTFTLCEFADLVKGAGAAASPTDVVASAAQRRGGAALDCYDIPDPYGASPVVHRAVADHVSACIEQMLPALMARVTSAAR